MSKMNSKQRRQDDQYMFPYHWNKNPSTYDGREYFGYLALCANLIDGRDKQTMEILDAGCGDGRFIKLLHDNGFVHLHGIDYSERAIAFARLLMPEAQFQLGDLVSAQSTGKQYDVIFFIETLEHIIPDQIPNVLKGLHQLLKNNGVLIISVPSQYGSLPQADSKHYQHFTVESLTENLSPLFSVKQVIGQDKISMLYAGMYKCLDNRFFDIKPLRRYFNMHIWKSQCNQCLPRKGRRLIVKCSKNI